MKCGEAQVALTWHIEPRAVGELSFMLSAIFHIKDFITVVDADDNAKEAHRTFAKLSLDTDLSLR